jgi:hypothetical protein
MHHGNCGAACLLAEMPEKQMKLQEQHVSLTLAWTARANATHHSVGDATGRNSCFPFALLPNALHPFSRLHELEEQPCPPRGHFSIQIHCLRPPHSAKMLISSSTNSNDSASQTPAR